MKCTIPEIAWHNRDPVLSLDIQCNEKDFYRLASGGTDCHILIWHLKIMDNGSVHQEVVSDLTRHQRAVNVVRWSPSGQYLASGDDDANIIIWTLKTDSIPLLDGESEKENKETWNVFKVLRGHKEDVYDICWSPDESKLLSGSIDNTAILWDLKKGKNELILKDHKGFVQGCTWDPKGDYIATLSSDRMCRIFNSTGKQVKARIIKGKLPVPETHPLYDKHVKYFHDDTFKSYFRRLSFSPDGNLLITPSGCVETEDCKKALHATYVFTLTSLLQPAMVLPSPKQCTIGVRCCPVLFELREEGSQPIIDLPYRMIIAVATDCDIILYDTQQMVPFAVLQNIHYTRLTDLTWSSDARLLAASSTDGYCTLITFDPEELGIPYTKSEVEPEDSVLNISGCAELDGEEVEEKDENVENEIIPSNESKPKKPTILEQWAIKTPKGKGGWKVDTPKKTPVKVSLEGSEAKPTEVICITDSPVKKETNEKQNRKRIAPIKIAEPVPSKKITANSTIDVKTNSAKKNIKAQETSGAKASPLASFLNKYSPGKAKTPKEKKTEKTISIIKNKENTGSCEIVEIIDEDEARDSWRVEVDCNAIISKENDSKEKVESPKHGSQEQTQTDAPEDFKLSVDDGTSQFESSKNEEVLSKAENGEDKPKQIVQEPPKTPRRAPFVTLSTKVDKKANVDAESNEKDTKECEQSEGQTREMPKTPRRVALITLSSPRNKKKRTT